MPPKKTAQRVRCYDVFDTVLTRLVSPPTAIFHLVGEACQEILPSGVSPSQYAALRVEAERHAQAWHAEATTLDRIFEQLQFLVAWEEEVLRLLKSEEIAMERRWIRPVPEIVAGIERWRAEGGAVAFVSDMYLPSHVIEGLLLDHGIYQSQDHLFVSCEHAAQKRDGRLFACVKDSLNPSTVFDQHIGNHAVRDVEGAKRAGIRGSFMSEANPNRYEAILEDAIPTCGVGAAQLAGASRYARLTAPAGTAHDKALRRVAAGVISPILVCFVFWILKEADKRSIERLYFTSRDGQLLHMIARRLAPLAGLEDIELRYVYFSRASTAHARCPNQMISQVWFRHRTAPVSGRDLLARIGLDPEDVVPHLDPDYSKSDLDKSPVKEGVFSALRSAVEAYTYEHSGNHATGDQRLLHQYLTQEGFMDGTSYAFVDLGWRGSIHSNLNGFLSEYGHDEVFPAFFFGLQKDQLDLKSYRQAYFFDKDRQLGIGSLSRIMLLMETFCTADHGTVISYRKQDGYVKPVLEQEWPERMKDWGLPIIQQTVSDFMHALETQPSPVQIEGRPLRTFKKLLNTFWRNPSAEEAEAWGRFPRELGQAKESYIQPLAPPYGLSDLLYFVRYGAHAHWLIKQRDPLLCWTPGRMATTPSSLRNRIKLAIGLHKGIQNLTRKALPL